MVVKDSRDTGDPRVGVLLEPFIHQVGGHVSMMKYDEHTICKPLISQEQRFYESLPLAMKQFTPQYKGTVTVHILKDSRGHLSLVASPLTDNCGPESSVMLWQKLKKNSSGHSNDCSLVQWKHTKLTQSLKESCPGKTLLRTEFHMSSFMEDTNGNQAEKSYNPWRLNCHKEHLTRMYSEYQENKMHRILAWISPQDPPKSVGKASIEQNYLGTTGLKQAQSPGYAAT